MVCDDVQTLLDPYVDGELDAAHALEVERHLPACPRCAADLAQLQGLRKALRRDLTYHRAPPPPQGPPQGAPPRSPLSPRPRRAAGAGGGEPRPPGAGGPEPPHPYR